jgi:hypothetical protein
VITKVIEERLLVLREPEKVVFLPDPLGLQRGVQRTVPVDEILFLFELLTADTVPPFVDAFVNVAGGVDAVRELGDADPVARFRGADEVVERHVEPPPCITKLLLHLVAVRERIQAQLDRLLEHVLRVFVVPHQEPRVEAGEALVARDHVGAHLLVRRTQMRPAVDVVDSRGQEESIHDRVAAYAAAAIA